jgi:hypothetical protein
LEAVTGVRMALPANLDLPPMVPATLGRANCFFKL